MLKCNGNSPATDSQNATMTLKNIGRIHSKKLVLTFLLVMAENITYLLYPLAAGFAINAILDGKALHAVIYGAMVFLMWGIGAARRSVDTRTFARIYAGIAVSVITAQRNDHKNTSIIVARANLSKEFVDFFELHLPTFITSIASIVGATAMLLMIEPWSGVLCIIIMVIFSFIVPSYTRKNELLFGRLNNRLEKEVRFVNSAEKRSLRMHYHVLSGLRICLSDREALAYLWIGVASSFFFAATILYMTHVNQNDAGHIYSVMTYMWMFVTSLDDGPRLLEKYSQLKDIGKRINTGIV